MGRPDNAPSLSSTNEETLHTSACYISRLDELKTLSSPEDLKYLLTHIHPPASRSDFICSILNRIRDLTHVVSERCPTSECSHPEDTTSERETKKFIRKPLHDPKSNHDPQPPVTPTKKVKRRITPTVLSTPEKRQLVLLDAFGHQQPSPNTCNSSSRPKEFKTPPKKIIPSMTPRPSKIRDVLIPEDIIVIPPSGGSPASASTHVDENPLTKSDQPPTFLSSLEHQVLSRVYGWMILIKCTPNSLTEIELLFRLLTSNHAQWTSFALETLSRITPLLLGISATHEAISSLLLKAIEAQMNANVTSVPLLLVDFVHSVQQAAQHTQKNPDDDSRNNANVILNGKSGFGNEMALPFCEATDSRHHFSKSPALLAIYTNRERSRDHFLSQLRLFYTRHQHQLDQPVHNNSNGAREVLKEVLPCNLQWFSHFFVQELLQVGLCQLGERDSEVLEQLNIKSSTSSTLNDDDAEEKQVPVKKKKATTTSDRLEKLHRRFSAPAQKKGNNFHRLETLPVTTRHPKCSTTKVKKPKPANVSAPPWACFLGTTQEFFYRFLESCDSYQLNVCLLAILVAQLHTLLRPFHESTSVNVKTHDFLSRVLKCKVLSRFIAYLTFHRGHSTFTEPAPHRALLGLVEAQQAQAELQSMPLDMVMCVERAQAYGTWVLNLPWICEYMKLSLLDPMTRQHPSMVSVWTTLDGIYHALQYSTHSPKARFCLSLQLETLFRSTNNVHVVSGFVSSQYTTVLEDTPDLTLVGLDALVETSTFVDASYVYHFCPELECAKSIMVSSFPSSSSGNQQPQPLRKVKPNTVVPNIKPLSTVTTTSSSLKTTDQKAMQNAFFRSHPNLHQLVLTTVNQVCDDWISGLEKQILEDSIVSFRLTFESKFRDTNHVGHDLRVIQHLCISGLRTFTRQTEERIVTLAIDRVVTVVSLLISSTLYDAQVHCVVREFASLLTRKSMEKNGLKLVGSWRVQVQSLVLRQMKAQKDDHPTSWWTQLQEHLFQSPPVTEERIDRQLFAVVEEEEDEDCEQENKWQQMDAQLQHALDNLDNNISRKRILHWTEQLNAVVEQDIPMSIRVHFVQVFLSRCSCGTSMISCQGLEDLGYFLPGFVSLRHHVSFEPTIVSWSVFKQVSVVPELARQWLMLLHQGLELNVLSVRRLEQAFLALAKRNESMETLGLLVIQLATWYHVSMVQSNAYARFAFSRLVNVFFPHVPELLSHQRPSIIMTWPEILFELQWKKQPVIIPDQGVKSIQMWNT